MAASLGEMPTTLARRLITALISAPRVAPLSRGRVPLRGVSHEARMLGSEGEHGGMTGCHSIGANAEFRGAFRIKKHQTIQKREIAILKLAIFASLMLSDATIRC